eukprot:Phypoly_transcript_12347.p1 GENE.Phypoly_transcript_12347~~Phypoly_transcript_12347.p1  ORF type:complete len:311 (+),score=50.18 Phypoly_transcript_12347:139-1071(+)
MDGFGRFHYNKQQYFYYKKYLFQLSKYFFFHLAQALIVCNEICASTRSGTLCMRTQTIETVTPPPASPSEAITTDMSDLLTNSISPTNNEGGIVSNSASLRGITLHSSPFRCEAYLQPEPAHAVASALQERVVRFFAFKSEGKSINDIRNSKAYKNPDILEKLVQHCGINEIGSNYPTELFDPLAFHPHDFYDSIALEQRRMEEKRPDDRSGNRNIEFASATASTSTKAQPDDKKRSKWDSMDSAAAAIMAGGAKPTLISPNPTNSSANVNGATANTTAGAVSSINPTVTVITGTAPATTTSNGTLSRAW